jgi:hypothetical protein
MPEQALITSRRARLPSAVKLLALLIIVLSVSGVAMAAFALTEGSVAVRRTGAQSTPQVVTHHLRSTHRPQRHRRR